MTDERTQRKELETTEYLSAAFEPSSHLAILVRNHRSKVTIQRIAAAARIVEPAFQEWLGHKNHRDGCDVYVGMNPLKASARTRTKDDILAIRHLYVDLDHEGQRALEAIRQSDAVPPPNYVLSTSPGKFQVIWKVEEIQQDQAERLLRQMARRLGGDPAATDSTRVLRLPGFVNHKYQSQFLVRAELYSERVYRAISRTPRG